MTVGRSYELRSAYKSFQYLDTNLKNAADGREMCTKLIRQADDLESCLSLYRTMTMLSIKSGIYIGDQIDFLLSQLQSDSPEAVLFGIAENLIIVAAKYPSSFSISHVGMVMKFLNSNRLHPGTRARLAQCVAAILSHPSILKSFFGATLHLSNEHQALQREIETFMNSTLDEFLFKEPFVLAKEKLKYTIAPTKLAIFLMEKSFKRFLHKGTLFLRL